MGRRSVDLRVAGTRELRMVARQLRAEADHLPAELRKGINEVLRVLPPKVRLEAAVLPSGYSPLLRRSLRFNKRVRLTGDVGITMVVRATGKVENRDVRALDTGRLRHPVYGHRSTWVTQKVRPGFVTEPFRRTAPEIRDRIGKVLDELVRRVARG